MAVQRLEIESVKGDTMFVNTHGIEKVDMTDFLIFRVYKDLTPEVSHELSDALMKLNPNKKFLVVPGYIRFCVFKEV